MLRTHFINARMLDSYRRLTEEFGEGRVVLLLDVTKPGLDLTDVPAGTNTMTYDDAVALNPLHAKHNLPGNLHRAEAAVVIASRGVRCDYYALQKFCNMCTSLENC